MQKTNLQEQWQMQGVEVELTEALDELKTDFPDLEINWEVEEDEDITARKPLRDLDVVTLLITVIATKITEELVDAAYNKLKSKINKDKTELNRQVKPEADENPEEGETKD